MLSTAILILNTSASHLFANMIYSNKYKPIIEVCRSLIPSDRMKSNPELRLLPHGVHLEIPIEVDPLLARGDLHVKAPEHLCDEEPRLTPRQLRPSELPRAAAEGGEMLSLIILERSIPGGMITVQPSLRPVVTRLVEVSR